MYLISKLPRWAETEIRGEGQDSAKRPDILRIREAQRAKFGEIDSQKGSKARTKQSSDGAHSEYERSIAPASAGFFFVGNVASHFG